MATLAVGAIVLAAGLAATLLKESPRRTGTNNVTVEGIVDRLSGDRRVCQDERVPADTAAVVVSATPSGRSQPQLDVALIDVSRRTSPLTARVNSWHQGEATAPLRSRVTRERPMRLCVQLATGQAGGRAFLLGSPWEKATGATRNGEPLGGRFRVSYLHPGAESWWAFAPTIVERMGRAGVWTGAVVPLIAGLLLSLSILLASWLLVRTS